MDKWCFFIFEFLFHHFPIIMRNKMNKFKNIVKNILERELWSSSCQIIPLIPLKDKNGHTIWNDEKIVDVKCLKKDTSKLLNDGRYAHFTEFYVAAKSIENDMLNKRLQINYNDKRYDVEEIVSMGTLDNDDALYKFIVRR